MSLTAWHKKENDKTQKCWSLSISMQMFMYKYCKYCCLLFKYYSSTKTLQNHISKTEILYNIQNIENLISLIRDKRLIVLSH